MNARAKQKLAEDMLSSMISRLGMKPAQDVALAMAQEE